MYNMLKAFLDPIAITFFIFFIAAVLVFAKKTRYAKVLFVVAIVFLYLFSIAPVANGLSYLLEKDYFKNSFNSVSDLDLVVVLAGGCSGNKHAEEEYLLPQTSSRLLYAMQVLKKSNASKLICSGASGKFVESEIMAKAATRAGIDAKSIEMDARSSNTREHAYLMSKQYDTDLKIGLVTSAYHMKRSEDEFKKYFNDIAVLPSEYLHASPKISIYTFLPRTTSLNKSFLAAREIVGICWYKLTDTTK
jgi:uncharacterized SAM-binding protein YcdF (DUF218 family)